MSKETLYIKIDTTTVPVNISEITHLMDTVEHTAIQANGIERLLERSSGDLGEHFAQWDEVSRKRQAARRRLIESFKETVRGAYFAGLKEGLPPAESN